MEGNFIGTDVTGGVPLGNLESGIKLSNSSNNIIGGTSASARNVVSGNHQYGIWMLENSSGNQVHGNYVGVDAAGTVDLGNAFAGVFLQDSPNNQIGGTTAGAGNVISGNDQQGINIHGSSASNNQISQNLIGRNAANSGPLGNSDHGILIESTGPNVIGGGFNPNNANTIAHNGGDGVSIIFGAGPCIKKGIIGNHIFANGGLGIDLNNDGVTPNDLGDPDTGPNTLQNFPVLTSAVVSGVDTTINGTFNSTPNTSFYIEFFASDDGRSQWFWRGPNLPWCTCERDDGRCGKRGICRRPTGTSARGPKHHQFDRYRQRRISKHI